MPLVSIKFVSILATFAMVTFFLIGPQNAAHAGDSTTNAYRQHLLQQWAWTRETWAGSDKTYQSIMSEVDKSIAQHENLDQLLGNYKALAKDSRTNPDPQFRWAYLAYKMSVMRATSDPVGLSLHALGRAASPHNYYYDRLRYLLSHQIGNSDYHLVSLGQRLLKREPNNKQLMLDVIRDLNDSRDDLGRSESQVLTDRKRALSLAKQYIARFPQSPAGYGVLSEVYSSSYYATGNTQAQTDTLAALHEYLQRLPANSKDADLAMIVQKRVEHGVVPYLGKYAWKDMMPR